MIRIALADDHAVFREGMRRVLEAQGDLAVAGEAGSGEELMALLRERAAEVVLLDVSMPGPGLASLLERIAAHHPAAAVLVLSAHSEERYALHALRAGARGYLSKTSSGAQIAAAIRQVAAGRKYISPAVAELMADTLSGAREGEPHELLSAREREVMLRIAAGESPASIAAALRLSSKTVQTYRARMMRKMGFKSTADVVGYSIRHGLLP